MNETDVNKEENKKGLDFKVIIAFVCGLFVGAGAVYLSVNNIVNNEVQDKVELIEPIKEIEESFEAEVKNIESDPKDAGLYTILLDNVKDKPMFNNGVVLHVDNKDMKVAGTKTSVKEIKKGDNIEVIVDKNAPTTMMMPPSIVGNAIKGINVK